MPTRILIFKKLNIGGLSDNFTITALPSTTIATGVTRAQLESGYTVNNVDTTYTDFRVASTGVCTNYIDINIPYTSTATLTLSTDSMTFPSNGNTLTFNITSSGQTWTVSSSQSWCTVNPTSGSNNQTIEVTVTQNPSETQIRQAQITVTGSVTGAQYITVTQDVGAPE